MSKQAYQERFSVAPGANKLERVRRQARALLRAARSSALVDALPALRRLHAAAVFGEASLSGLVARREQVRLKHCLRALAVEFGHPSWEVLRPLIESVPALLLDRDQRYRAGSASLNLWFRDEAQARAHVASHGGQLILLGRQAVVLEVAGPSGD